jgi:iron complex transport system ATP-binding protein
VGIVRLDVRDLSWTVENARVLVDAAVSCPDGTFVGLVGPNGSGKSSLLRCIYRVIKPDAGNVTIDGRDVWDQTPRALARDLAVVVQERPTETAFAVREIVLMARGPHKRLLEQDTPDDHQLVATALRRVGIESLSERMFDTLSGGEKQRVVIARALAQAPRVLVLDEPTTCSSTEDNRKERASNRARRPAISSRRTGYVRTRRRSAGRCLRTR